MVTTAASRTATMPQKSLPQMVLLAMILLIVAEEGAGVEDVGEAEGVAVVVVVHQLPLQQQQPVHLVLL